METKDDKTKFHLNEFSDIVKKAYYRGESDKGVTVAILIEELKLDLLKIKVN